MYFCQLQYLLLEFKFMIKRFLLFVSIITSFFTLKAQTSIENQDELKSLSERWDLDKENRQGTFKLASYRPIYVTAGRWSSNPNTLPQSENPDFSTTVPEEYNNFEAKFQLSFKSKVAQSLYLALPICGSDIPRKPIGKFIIPDCRGLLGS